GGILSPRLDIVSANALLVLFVLGIAMAALPPLHRWLPASSVAPFPAATLIQGVAVVNCGGVGILKVAAYVFGFAMSRAVLATQGLLILAGAAMCMAALIALSKQELRERLAYSMMAQSAAVIMGALLALPIGTFAAALQIVAQACAATTLIMAAGTVH